MLQAGSDHPLTTLQNTGTLLLDWNGGCEKWTEESGRSGIYCFAWWSMNDDGVSVVLKTGLELTGEWGEDQVYQ